MKPYSELLRPGARKKLSVPARISQQTKRGSSISAPLRIRFWNRIQTVRERSLRIFLIPSENSSMYRRKLWRDTFGMCSLQTHCWAILTVTMETGVSCSMKVQKKWALLPFMIAEVVCCRRLTNGFWLGSKSWTGENQSHNWDITTKYWSKKDKLLKKDTIARTMIPCYTQVTGIRAKNKRQKGECCLKNNRYAIVSSREACIQ